MIRESYLPLRKQRLPAIPQYSRAFQWTIIIFLIIQYAVLYRKPFVALNDTKGSQSAGAVY